MIKNKIFMMLVVLTSFSFLQMDCKDEPIKPCTDCPPPIGDSLITFEKELCNGQMPAVSPDGSKIAYTFNGDIWVIDTAGIQIVTWVDSSKQQWIWHTDTIAGKPTQLTFGPEIDVMPRWRPDGQTIGFVRLQSETDDNGKIFTVAPNGNSTTEIPLTHFFSNKLRLEADNFGSITVPIWDFSPDGKYIAFLSNENDSTYLNVVISSSGAQMVYKNLFGQFDDTPGFAWSINKGEIAFIKEERDSTNQKRTRTHLFNFVNNTTKQDSLVWSGKFLSRTPLSNLFLYAAIDSSFRSVILFTNLSSISNRIYVSQIIGRQSFFQNSIKISPDEKFLTYYSWVQVGGPFSYRYSQIYVYNIEKQKEYLLLERGDEDRSNYYFEWSKESNAVYYEKYKKIWKSSFHF